MNTIVIFNGKNCIEVSDSSNIHTISNEKLDELVSKYDIEDLKFGSKNGGKAASLGEDIKYYKFDKKMILVGTSKECDIRINSIENFLIVLDKKSLRVIEGNIYLNGIICNQEEYRIFNGDVIFIGSIKLDFNINKITVTGLNFTSSLNQSFEDNIYKKLNIEYKRSPRIHMAYPTDNVEIKKVGAKPEKEKNVILKRIAAPFLSLVIMVTMGIVLKRGIYVLMSAGMMVTTVVISIMTGIQSSKEKKEKEKSRIDNYKKYLLIKRSELFSLKKKQIEASLYQYPNINDIEKLCENYSNRIYERAPEHADFLTFSLGLSTCKPSFSIKYEEDFENSNDALTKEVNELYNTFKVIEDLPFVIDLKESHIGLIGEKKYIFAIEKILISQLCFFHSYHDIEIIMFTDSLDIKEFSGIYWYPHFKIHSINVNSLVYTGNHAELILATLTRILKERKIKMSEDRKEKRFSPHFVFILDDPLLVINHSIMEYLQVNGSKLGFSIIYVSSKQENLPDYIKTVIKFDGNEFAKVVLNNGILINKEIKLYNIEKLNMENMARRLAALKHVKGMFSQIPESISFFELYNVSDLEELNINKRWSLGLTYKSLAVPLGVRAKDDIVYLNLHEKAHGPHGLVAGTTGSGKSEILQTLILSLAINFSPEDIGFLLIDYKGGGMANLFKELPHLLGTITNLDGSESMRALASIKSELARRQRIFNSVNVNNINEYTKLYKLDKANIPLPHLFIISDEFAELKHEQPEFMAELVSTSRIGRSLGVHLILATQKPSGIVDDQIWSNSKFKLALKVQDTSDSNEVLKTPDAAQITQPGRAYLQVGNNEVYELFQSAFSGARFNSDNNSQSFDKRIYKINFLGQKELLNDDYKESDEKNIATTQLEAVINYIKSIYENTKYKKVDKTWLPSLSQKILNPNIHNKKSFEVESDLDLKAEIGVVDLPEIQTQKEFVHDFIINGNIIVFGAQSSGKSTFITNIALTLSCKNRTELLNFYFLDFGNSALIQLKALPQTADYMNFEDNEKLIKLVKRIEEEVKLRKKLFAQTNSISFTNYNSKASDKLPAIIIFIDNYDVIKELDMDLELFINKLSRDGVGIGIYLVATATRQGAVRYSILNNFKIKIAQYLYDKTDLISIVGRSSYQLQDIKGRSLVKLEQVNIMQCYIPTELENYTDNIDILIKNLLCANLGEKPSGIKIMPEFVTLDMILSKTFTKRQIAIGLDSEDIEPQYLELSGNINMIVGRERTGKTNVLKLIIEQLQDTTVYICENIGGELNRRFKDESYFCFNNEKGAKEFLELLKLEVEKRIVDYEVVQEFKSRKAFCDELPLATLIIDDADYFIKICKSIKTDMENLIPTALDYGISIILTTAPGKLKDFDELTRTFKNPASGIVLGSPEEQSFLRVPIIRNYKPLVGVGFIVKMSEVKKIHIPLR